MNSTATLHPVQNRQYYSMENAIINENVKVRLPGHSTWGRFASDHPQPLGDLSQAAGDHACVLKDTSERKHELRHCH